MSLCTISDGFLARRAAAGDDVAFAELARRYRPLIRYYSVEAPAGIDVDDLRQAALLGLLDTCRKHDPAKGPFRALAKSNVRSRVNAARKHARALKHRLLSDAAHDGDEPGLWLQARVAAPAGTDPLRAVDLRAARVRRAHPQVQQTGQPLVVGRRRFTPAEIAHAVELVRTSCTARHRSSTPSCSRPRSARRSARSAPRSSCDAAGGHLSGDPVRDGFYAALIAAGLGHMRYAELPSEANPDGVKADDPIVFHDTRHTFGTLLAAAGVDLVKIQKWMGHAHIQTTMRYLHYVPQHDDAARLTAAFTTESVHPAVHPNVVRVP